MVELNKIPTKLFQNNEQKSALWLCRDIEYETNYDFSVQSFANCCNNAEIWSRCPHTKEMITQWPTWHRYQIPSNYQLEKCWNVILVQTSGAIITISTHAELKKVPSVPSIQFGPLHYSSNFYSDPPYTYPNNPRHRCLVLTVSVTCYLNLMLIIILAYLLGFVSLVTRITLRLTWDCVEVGPHTSLLNVLLLLSHTLLSRVPCNIDLITFWKSHMKTSEF